ARWQWRGPPVREGRASGLESCGYPPKTWQDAGRKNRQLEAIVARRGQDCNPFPQKSDGRSTVAAPGPVAGCARAGKRAACRYGLLGPAAGPLLGGLLGTAVDVQLDRAERRLVTLQRHAQGAEQALGGVEVHDQAYRDVDLLAALVE